MLFRSGCQGMDSTAQIVALDDDDEFLEELSYWFSINKLRAFCTTDPSSAMSVILRNRSIKVILVDFKMPLINGRNFIVTIYNQITSDRALCFIIITANAEDIENKMIIEGRQVEVLHKPLDLERLRHLIERNI